MMKKSHIVILIMMAVGVFVLFSSSKDISTYKTFSTAKKSVSSAKIVGELVDVSKIVFDPEDNPNYFSFYLKDSNGEVMQVVSNKPKPRDFELSEQVVVTGKVQEDVFVAEEILLKCPSKYKDEELALRQQ